MIITEFKYEYEFLSNFYLLPEPMIYRGEDFITSEHAYQAFKTIDTKWYDKIKNAPSPGKAKTFGQKCPLRPNWDTLKNFYMYRILEAKFTNENLKEKLLATDNATLIEGNWWHDNYWGDCSCIHCRTIKGRNLLGIFLELIRANLREKN